MKNFKVLLKYSLKPKFSGRKQVISYALLFLFPLLLIGFGGQLALNLIESEEVNDQIADVVYITPPGKVADALSTNFSNVEIIDETDQVITKMSNEDDVTELIIDLDNNQITSDFNIGMQDSYGLNAVINEVRMTDVINGLDVHTQMEITRANSEFEYTNKFAEDNDNNSVLGAVGFANTFIIYMIIIFGFQLLGSEIFEEKSSRAMEVIITNTKPHVHMLVKVCSTLIFLVSIILTILIGAILGIVILYMSNPDTVGVLVDQLLELLKTLDIAVNFQLLIFIIFTVLSGLLAVLLFQIIAAVAAAMTTSYEDYQKANGPIVILLLVPYMISMIGIEALAKILVYFPFFTPFFAPSLYLSEDISLVVFGACITLQAITVIVLYKVLAPVYREGLLNYSTSSFKQIIKRSYKNK
ncbi:ABC transporter permease [Mollicutes bacterium LVI A0078]|nr:ABC transporter permease [Mollicutes bacterium LVI A0075]WOO90713.1 ABC transporter permease [Mollicutes bacterium LVI A0078]